MWAAAERQGNNVQGFKDFCQKWLKRRPGSGLDCLICAKRVGQRVQGLAITVSGAGFIIFVGCGSHGAGFTMQGCHCHGAGLMRHGSGFKDLNLGLEVLDVGNRGTSLTRKNHPKTLQ